VTYTWLALPTARKAGVAAEARMLVIKPMASETLINIASATALRRVVGRFDIPSCPPERPVC
jgi:hypothetical protein